MPSFKSRIVATYLRHARKKVFSSAELMNTRITRSRRRERHEPPIRLARRVDIAPGALEGHPLYDVRPRTGAGRLHIVYLHGGAYCYQITPFHWRLIAELAERLDARVTVPIYPLAPEHSIHDIMANGMAALELALETTDPADLVFVGDSAGGNMAVVVSMAAAARGLPQPGRMVLISPGLDMTLENPEVFEVEPLDPWLGIDGGLEAVRLYGGGLERTDWRISPIKGDLSALPRTLIFAGARDILTPDTRRFARMAAEAGVDVELVVEEDMFHVWPLIDMPEARRARDRIVEWLSAPAVPPMPVRQQPIRTAPSP